MRTSAGCGAPQQQIIADVRLKIELYSNKSYWEERNLMAESMA